jgi:hypothetical protein
VFYLLNYNFFEKMFQNFLNIILLHFSFEKNKQQQQLNMINVDNYDDDLEEDVNYNLFSLFLCFLFFFNRDNLIVIHR